MLSPAATRLATAGQHLQVQLATLQAQPVPASGLPDLGGLLSALGSYEQAVRACLPLPLDWPANPTPTPAELLAEREQQPLYRLGWVRGYQAGKVAGPPPAPIDPEALMQQVRELLTRLRQCYGAGPLIQVYPSRTPQSSRHAPY